jgi:ribonuclease BN (tRNA processing enzyme)
MLPALGFVLDAGTGFFRVRDHLCTPHLHVFLSHVHLDHVCGLNYLLDVLHEKPVRTVVVYGLAEHLEVVPTVLFGSRLFPLKFPYRTRAVKPRFEVEKVQVRTCLLDHPGQSVGYRFDGPTGSLAYITDTRCSEAYADFVRGVDLLVHECNFPDRHHDLAERTGHSSLGPVLRLARAAQVRQLCLTHINPLLDPTDPVGLAEASDVFPGVIVAMDGMEIETGQRSEIRNPKHEIRNKPQ